MSIMIQGTGSNVGKSMLVAGLARALKRRGLNVAPFKPQNMSNNAAVSIDGGEIGRAQAFQARAAGLDPHTDMNPVLLKPESSIGSQVVVQGKVFKTVRAQDYAKLKPSLLPRVLESFERLAKQFDIVLVEGAGSPAEINLRAGDIANIGFAQAANVPVVLVGDIDRGGVIAQIVGTKAVLPHKDAEAIKAFIINKFRGDIKLFEDGYQSIEALSGWPGLGVVPWFSDAHYFPAEDSADIRSKGDGPIKVVALQLSRIANFDDLDPLSNDPRVEMRMLAPGKALPADTDLVIIPGSKSTISDLVFIREQGWDIDLMAHHRRGGHVLGLCGGYQILGTTICDPDGIEGTTGQVDGLDLLKVTTEMIPDKAVVNAKGHAFENRVSIDGYEIHIGRTSGPDCSRAWVDLGDRMDGAISPDGLVMGTYLHGLFTSDRFRNAYLDRFDVKETQFNYNDTLEQKIDALADHCERYIDIDALLEIAKRDH